MDSIETNNIYYVVHKGHKPGIYTSWNECKINTDGYKYPVFRKFDNLSDAQLFLKIGKKSNIMTSEHKYNNSESIDMYTDGSLIPRNLSNYSGYGVYIPLLNIKISSAFDDENKTNNRAELTAIFIGLSQLLSYSGYMLNINIFTDSKYSILMLSKNKTITKDTLNYDILNNINDLILKLNQHNTCAINYIHIYAHTNNTDINSVNNNIVDQLAFSGAIIDYVTFLNNTGTSHLYVLCNGKYKGTQLCNLPDKYIFWIMSNNSETTNMVFIIEKEIITQFHNCNMKLIFKIDIMLLYNIIYNNVS